MRAFRVLGVMICALALVAGCAGPSAAGTPVGGQPLAFTARTVSGQDFSGQSLRGRPGVLWFWAPWCPTCQREAPTIAKVARANPSVTFVGVAALDQVPAMRTFVDTYRLGGFAQLADTDGAVWRHFGVTAQPAFAFVDPDGSVRVVPGELTEQQLTERITTLARP